MGGPYKVLSDKPPRSVLLPPLPEPPGPARIRKSAAHRPTWRVLAGRNLAWRPRRSTVTTACAF
eukprot:6303741-Prymnesium_polylepis.1